MSLLPAQIDAGVIIRRSLFFIVLILLTLGHLFTIFRGLDSPQAMDQAQIAREIARGNGFSTKFIRPVAYYQAQLAEGRTVPFTNFQDTYHAPLNPLLNAAVLKIIGADDPNQWQMGTNQLVHPLDRVIAAVSTLFFLVSIGITYLLVTRIFDAKIAGVTALLMLFCETFWNYALSGLPQMLMLMLFSAAMYFVYRAVEAATEGRVAMTPAVIAGVFFTLLALSHWMTVWLLIGYIIFAAIVFRPRGVVGIVILGILFAAAIGPIIRNIDVSDHPLGTAFLTLYNGLGSGDETDVMRTTDLETEPLVMQGIISKIVRTSLLQGTDIIPFLGGIVVAPLFFIALLHPFKRPSIGMFRWAILLMWVFNCLGLAFFGVSKDRIDPNQLHLLFAPIMTAYGLAIVSVLWARLDVVNSTPLLKNVHLILIVILCALPLTLSLPQKVSIGLHLSGRGGRPNWPPYYATGLNNTDIGIKGWTSKDQIIFSDQPWAVAWYADRISIWLPPTVDGFLKLESKAADLQTPAVGILISPSSHGSGPISEVAARYKDFAALVLDGRVIHATYPPGYTVLDKSDRLKEIAKRYPYRQSIVFPDMIYYSDRAIRIKGQEDSSQ